MNFNSYYFIFIATIFIKPCCLTELRLGIILPEDSSYPWSMERILPAIEIAIENVRRFILPDTRVVTYVRDSECSETNGPLAAMDLYMTEHVHVFFGPVCAYAIAPVARFSPHWNIPLITAGASVKAFDDKSEYQLLTRVHETYSSAANSIMAFANEFGWTKFGILYDDKRSSKGKSECYFRMEAIFQKIRETFQTTPWHRRFTEESPSKTDIDGILQSASSNARIFLICASSDLVREFMIQAHELGFDKGEFVFINIDHGGNSGNKAEMPWYREEDTDERNRKARTGYEALLTITVRRQISAEYRQFSEEVKIRAKQRYENFAYDKNDRFAGAFHDAVVLYGLAVNETINAGESISDGKEVTRRMWNTTFTGITGTVAIGENGDRQMDYSFLDMDPRTGKFQVVANYHGVSKEVMLVPGRQIHWGVDFAEAPTDVPKCGFDNSKCIPNGESSEESSTPSQPSSVRQKAEELLENMQHTFERITKAVEEHKSSIEALTKLINEETV